MPFIAQRYITELNRPPSYLASAIEVDSNHHFQSKHAELIKANLHKFEYSLGKLYWNDDYAPRARKGQIVGSVDSSGYLQVGLDNQVN